MTARQPSPAVQAQVRPALRHEADAVIGLRSLMFQAMQTVDGGPTPAALGVEPEPWREAAARWVRDNVDDPLVRIVVADVDGVVAATGIGEVTWLVPAPTCPNGAVGYVFNIVVHPDFRGFGLGAACADALIAWLTDETDVTRIDLFSTPEAQPMYERRGFRIHGFPSYQRHIPRD